jgi:hypothetical protein
MKRPTPTSKRLPALIGSSVPNGRGVLHYEIKSLTRKGIRHQVAIRSEDGRVHCSCEDFRFRCQHACPTLWTGQHCKHIAAYAEALRREWFAANGISTKTEPSLTLKIQGDDVYVAAQGRWAEDFCRTHFWVYNHLTIDKVVRKLRTHKLAWKVAAPGSKAVAA